MNLIGKDDCEDSCGKSLKPKIPQEQSEAAETMTIHQIIHLDIPFYRQKRPKIIVLTQHRITVHERFLMFSLLFIQFLAFCWHLPRNFTILPRDFWLLPWNSVILSREMKIYPEIYFSQDGYPKKNLYKEIFNFTQTNSLLPRQKHPIPRRITLF